MLYSIYTEKYVVLSLNISVNDVTSKHPVVFVIKLFVLPL